MIKKTSLRTRRDGSCGAPTTDVWPGSKPTGVADWARTPTTVRKLFHDLRESDVSEMGKASKGPKL